MKYNTRQRNALLSLLRENPEKCFSVKDVLSIPELNLGETTVYRTLNMLAQQGYVKKFARSDEAGATYQLNEDACRNHFHLKCKSCGKLIHTECDFLSQINDHIANKHGFRVDSSLTVFYGECSDCFTKGKN